MRELLQVVVAEQEDEVVELVVVESVVVVVELLVVELVVVTSYAITTSGEIDLFRSSTKPEHLSQLFTISVILWWSSEDITAAHRL